MYAADTSFQLAHKSCSVGIDAADFQGCCFNVMEPLLAGCQAQQLMGPVGQAQQADRNQDACWLVHTLSFI